jgi:hypothetical protein
MLFGLGKRVLSQLGVALHGVVWPSQVVFLLRYITTNEELVEKALSAIFDWVHDSCE